MRKLRKTRISTVIASIVMLISMLFPVASTSAARLKSATPAHAASLSPVLSVSSQLNLRRYVASGDRAYELGSEDGLYPAMGFHTRGEMGGIWSPPIKLLDGIWFGINGQWIGPATSFTSGFGYVQMALPTTGKVQITRTDFAPDGLRAVEFGLTLTASNSAPFQLNVDAHSELMSAYPWGFTTPNQLQFNLPDTAQFNGNQLVFQEDGTPPVPNASHHSWAAVVGATGLTPDSGITGSAFRGPQDPPVICPAPPAPDKFRCDDTAYGQGAGGELTYTLKLHAKTSTTVWFTVASSTRDSAMPSPSIRRLAQIRPVSYRTRSPRASHWTARRRCRSRPIQRSLPRSPGANKTSPTSRNRPTTYKYAQPRRVLYTPRQSQPYRVSGSKELASRITHGCSRPTRSTRCMHCSLPGSSLLPRMGFARLPR